MESALKKAHIKIVNANSQGALLYALPPCILRRQIDGNIIVRRSKKLRCVALPCLAESAKLRRTSQNAADGLRCSPPGISPCYFLPLSLRQRSLHVSVGGLLRFARVSQRSHDTSLDAVVGAMVVWRLLSPISVRQGSQDS